MIHPLKGAQIKLLLSKQVKVEIVEAVEVFLHTRATSTESPKAKDYSINDNNHLTIKSKEILKLKLEVLSFRGILTSGGVRSLARNRKDGSRNSIFAEF
jgi:hypothetical protein